jgi:NAD(P)-dependent dehydrogenase (short-subunit alcohol dehydrogenase family)
LARSHSRIDASWSQARQLAANRDSDGRLDRVHIRRCRGKAKTGLVCCASICGAMEGLTRALAVELAPVRVNIVSPGIVKTPLWREMPEEARESLYASEARRLPVGHVADAQEIAEGYLYLMRQTFVTGQTLVIDGGGLLV